MADAGVAEIAAETNALLDAKDDAHYFHQRRKVCKAVVAFGVIGAGLACVALSWRLSRTDSVSAAVQMVTELDSPDYSSSSYGTDCNRSVYNAYSDTPGVIPTLNKYGTPLRTTYDKTQEECQKECDENDNCWSYITCPSNGKCQIKNDWIDPGVDSDTYKSGDCTQYSTCITTAASAPVPIPRWSMLGGIGNQSASGWTVYPEAPKDGRLLTMKGTWSECARMCQRMVGGGSACQSFISCPGRDNTCYLSNLKVYENSTMRYLGDDCRSLYIVQTTSPASGLSPSQIAEQNKHLFESE